MVSVVIPAYNEEKLLPACLDSLAAQKTSKKFEVLVVDNNSTDGTAKIAKSYTDKIPNLKILFEEKKGRGQARYTGFAQASGDIILSCDADAIVAPNWVEEMTLPFRGNPKLAATTSSCKINDGSLLTNAVFNIIQPAAMHYYRIFHGHYWLNGFSFGIKKNTYRRSGEFNPNLKALEDFDLALRVRKEGDIQYISAAKVIFSGRRFQKNFLQGLISYIKAFFTYRMLKKDDIDLEDLR
jgi:glycosyltransferase involved in cell wall biosynthesis